MNQSKIQGRASSATKVLEEAWEKLRAIHRMIPEAIVVLLSAGDRNRQRGHWLASAWAYNENTRLHEIGISPNLFQQPKGLFGTMLHEAAHAILASKNGGCGNDGYYHNDAFRVICMYVLGLECEKKDKRCGWCITRLTTCDLSKDYEPIIAHLKKNLPLGTMDTATRS